MAVAVVERWPLVEVRLYEHLLRPTAAIWTGGGGVRIILKGGNH